MHICALNLRTRKRIFLVARRASCSRKSNAVQQIRSPISTSHFSVHISFSEVKCDWNGAGVLHILHFLCGNFWPKRCVICRLVVVYRRFVTCGLVVVYRRSVTCGLIVVYRRSVICGLIVVYRCFVTCGLVVVYRLFVTCGLVVVYRCFVTCGLVVVYQCCSPLPWPPTRPGLSAISNSLWCSSINDWSRGVN